jgi:Flp pilus assembly protein TadD
VKVNRLPPVSVVAVATAAVLAVAYANALDGALVFDDEVSITENSSIRELFPIDRVLFAKAEGGRPHDSRPLLNLSLALNYAAHGLWLPGFRLGNLAIHLANICLVFDVARRLLRLSRGAPRSFIVPAAAVTAIVWAAHPLHTLVNTYVIQRAESLAAVFILGAFDLAVVALSNGSVAAAVIAALVAAAGGLAKETTVAVLPLVAAFHWAFRDRLTVSRSSASGGSSASSIVSLRAVLYGGLALNPVVLAAVAWAMGGRGASAGIGTADTWHYLLTQSRAVWLYVGKLFWPATLLLDHGDAVVTGIADVWPYAIASALVLAGIGVGFCLRPQPFFPLVAAVLLLAPSSSVVPVATQTVAEHRMYLPSACIIGGVVAAVARAIAGSPQRSRLVPLAAMLVAAVVIAEVGRTAVRNRDFASATTLWAQNVRDCPANDRGLTNLVASLIREGRFDEAEPLAQAAVASRPDRDRNWLNMGRLLAEAGHDDGAITAFNEAERLAPGGVDARINRAIVMSRGERVQEAIRELDDVIAARPDIAKGWLARGLARLRSGRPDLAVADLEAAVSLDPENPAGCENLQVARNRLAEQEP